MRLVDAAGLRDREGEVGDCDAAAGQKSRRGRAVCRKQSMMRMCCDAHYVSKQIVS